eukprot:c11645_g1_i4.p1 GENE.c11645_g1_i4~~c11645_g1_i4.p1  ORF type:complete len:132 (-),score=29.13 c11645_g1_i4:386-781(-)
MYLVVLAKRDIQLILIFRELSKAQSLHLQSCSQVCGVAHGGVEALSLSLLAPAAAHNPFAFTHSGIFSAVALPNHSTVSSAPILPTEGNIVADDCVGCNDVPEHENPQQQEIRCCEHTTPQDSNAITDGCN